MPNFEVTVEKVEVQGLEKARAGLFITSERVQVETPIFVTQVAQFAGERLKANVPVGETGNLRAAVYHDLHATPVKDPTTGRFIGGGLGWEARAGIRDYPISFFRNRRANIGGRSFEFETDSPITYALALNDGRRALSKPGDSRAGNQGTKFAWFSRTGNLDENKMAKSSHGYNVFKRYLGPREGKHFLERTNAEVDAYVEAHLSEFINRFGRTSLASRRRLLEDIGRFSGNPRDL
jgi:hypothetical protein